MPRLQRRWRTHSYEQTDESRQKLTKKTKIGTEVAHVTLDSDTTFKVKRSKVKVTRPVYSLRHLRTSSCSGQHGNVLSGKNCCSVAVCRRGGRLGLAVLRRPHGEERGGGILCRTCTQLVITNTNKLCGL